MLTRSADTQAKSADEVLTRGGAPNGSLAQKERIIKKADALAIRGAWRNPVLSMAVVFQTSFDVLGNRPIGADIVAMEWCPTMDLLALITVDSQLMVHRPAGWQRLFLHTGFDHPITSLGWRPDGQILAVGHMDGRVSLFGVENGDLLSTSVET